MFYRGSFKVIPPKFIPSSIKDRELAAYFTLSACFFSLLQFQTTYLIDRDLYYHIQIANLMLEHGDYLHVSHGRKPFGDGLNFLSVKKLDKELYIIPLKLVRK